MAPVAPPAAAGRIGSPRKAGAGRASSALGIQRRPQTTETKIGPKDVLGCRSVRLAEQETWGSAREATQTHCRVWPLPAALELRPRVWIARRGLSGLGEAQKPTPNCNPPQRIPSSKLPGLRN